jgi:ribosome-associated heat shock protein Hsp15
MSDHSVRVDKWLWAARFFKTRSAATEAVQGGKIEVNGEGVKPARPLHVGDVVRIRIAPFQHTVTVTGMAERRGSAPAAATHYAESADSIAARKRQREALRLAPSLTFSEGKPDKKARRTLRKLRGE